MSGHSKWSTIKRKKGTADAKRGALFAKITKELIVATQLEGNNPENNQRLRVAIGKAKNFNMPKNKIEQAIASVEQKKNKEHYQELIFEAFISGGGAIIIIVHSDKRSRTTPEIKNILKKHHTELASPQSVLRLFEFRSTVVLKRDIENQKQQDNLLLETLADFSDTLIGDWTDLSATERLIEFSGHLQIDFIDKLNALDFIIINSDSGYYPTTPLVSFSDEQHKQFKKLYTQLKEHPEVDAIFYNIQS